MPNDLAKRNLLNGRADSRQKLTSSGFTASIWTISGVVLAACSSVEDLFGLGGGGGGGGGGNTLHVQRSPVQGARLYFDMDNDGDIDTADETAQDEAFPQGFFTDATGQARNIPTIFQGLPFKAVLDGAIDVDTGAPLSGEMLSIPDANGAHRLASPITDLIADDGRDPKEVVAELLGNPDADSEEVAQILEAINNPRSYLGGDDGIEGLAFFLATATAPTDSEVQAQVALLLNDDPADPNRDTLIVLNADSDPSTADVIDLPDATIGAHDSYVATIQAVSHAGAVQYSIVAPADNEAFNVDSQGIISVVEGAPLADTTLRIEVSNGIAAETEIVQIDITVEPAPTLNELPAGDEVGTIMENEQGGTGGTALITGITPTAALTNPTWQIREASPAGLSDILSKFGIVADGNTYNLVLLSGQSLDYDAIPGGVLNLHVWAVENGVRSNALELQIQVEEDPDEIAFSGSFTGIVAEDGNLVARGTFNVENQPENEDVAVSGQGTYGALTLEANGAWTYTLTDTHTDVDALLTGEVLLDSVTITVGGESQNILIRINGANEDVRFENADDVRVSVADVPEAMDIEIGDTTALNGSFALGNVLTDLGVTLEGRLDSAETTTVAFADSVSAEMRALFTLSADGDLVFTGTSAQAQGLGTGIIRLEIRVSTPASTTEDIPLTVRVNVANDVDNDAAGSATYEINGDTSAVGNLLTAQIATGGADVDGLIAGSERFAWYRGDDTSGAPISSGSTYTVTADDVDETITLVVTYTDGSGTPETSEAATTPVRFPTRPSAMELQFAENDADATLTVTATSTDAQNNPATINTYMFVYTDQNGQEQVASDYRGFTIDNNGAITLTGDTPLNYEAASSYDLRIRATDENSEVGHLSITITVGDENDNDPAFAQPTYTADIDETLGNGAEVARVSATDADGTTENNQVFYSITAGNTGNVFDIDDNGVITVLDASALDFDTTSSYTLTIGASDGLDASGTRDQTFTADATATVTITVNDINDIVPVVTPPSPSDTFTIRTTNTQGVSSTDTGTGYRITIADADTNNDFTFNVDDPTRFAFQDQGNGVWELFLLANQEVTEDVDDLITVNYQVNDGERDSANPGSVTFTVVDSPIKFSQAPIDIDEDQDSSAFATLTASVDDAPGGHSITFAWGPAITGELSNLFGLTSAGALTVDGNLDRETGEASYILPIRITYDVDGDTTDTSDQETRDVNVVVNVGDVNEFAPVFVTNADDSALSDGTEEVAENAANGDRVGLFRATDADATNNVVTYSLDDGGIGAFGIRAVDDGTDNWEIYVLDASILDYDSGTTSYTLEITASDSDPDSAMSSAPEAFTVTLTDVNDNAPDIVVADAAPSVRERTASADTDIITDITVTDADTDKTYAQGDFALTGDPRFDFVWDATAQTGRVVLTSGETIAPSTISLSLTVTDANPVGHSGTDTQTLTITVTEKPPLVNGGNTGMAMQYDPSAADATGTLTYIDSTLVKATPVAGDYTATDGTYGTATVDETGAWTYNVDNTNADVAALTSGGTLTDTFTISVPLADGGTQDADVTITINHNAVTTVDGTVGADVAPTPPATSPVNPLDRSTSTTFDIIQGGNGHDQIKSGSGGSIIIGGYGTDTIDLGSGADTVIVRISSRDTVDKWRLDDGADTISNFERGVDKVILLDQDDTAIDLEDLLDYAGTSGPQQAGGVVITWQSATTEQGGNIGGFSIQMEGAGDDNGPFVTGGDDASNTLKVVFKEGLTNAEAVTAGLFGAGGAGTDPNDRTILNDYQYVPAWFGTSGSFVGLEVYDEDDFGITISDFA